MTKSLVVLVCMLVPALALAQPAGSGAGSAPSSGSAPAAGSGSAPAAGSGSAPAAPDPAPPTPPTPPAPDAAALRKTCVDAMNADETFEKKIVEIADQKAAERRLQADLEQHEKAAAAVAKNQKHVILAYAAMWIVAAAFVLFLWSRQQALKGEIAQLKADLDAATKDTK